MRVPWFIVPNEMLTHAKRHTQYTPYMSILIISTSSLTYILNGIMNNLTYRLLWIYVNTLNYFKIMFIVSLVEDTVWQDFSYFLFIYFLFWLGINIPFNANHTILAFLFAMLECLRYSFFALLSNRFLLLFTKE